MPIQDYNIYTAKGYAGDRYDSAPSVTQSGIVEDATLDYGVGTKPGTRPESGPQGVLAGHTAGNVWGISMRELNHEAANRPSDGTAQYVQTETASIMREGFILVKLGGAVAATPNTLLHVVDASGVFTMDAVAAGIAASVNVTSLENGQPGDIIKVRIDIVHD